MSEDQGKLFDNESFDDGIIDNEVFVGPVTAKELEITWRKRITFTRPSTECDEKDISEPTGDKEDVKNVLPAADESVKENAAPAPLLKPAKLIVQLEPTDLKWAKKINMKKVDKPKRPAYILSPSKFN
ncbi:uncharacterized protein isoform X2 [Rhodnius prolixus]|uniref:uncharacterized protein isoform X2 n=1 Tax=Rhodnius prolixus TaxID=13249 RepID=UPI003D187DEE